MLLTEFEIQKIKAVFERPARVKKVILFGSRAKGNFKPGSDIDLSIFGENLKLADLLKLYENLENLDLPYTFDLEIFDRIEEPALKDPINKVGVSFFEQGIKVN